MKGLNLLARAVAVLLGSFARTPDGSLWVWATVTDDSPLRVQLDGELAPLDIATDTGALVANLAVGDRVWCQLVTNADPARRHRRLVIHGRQGGPLVASSVGTTQLANDSVTAAKLANMAQATIKGRASGAGTGDPSDLTAAQVRAIIGTTRMGCSIRRAAVQSIPNAGASATLISFDTQDADTDGLFAPTSTTVTIPSTGAGIWAVTARVSFASAIGTGRAFLSLELSGGVNDVYRHPISGNGETFVGAGWVLPLAASDTVKIQVYQSSGAANDMTAELHCYRVGV